MKENAKQLVEMLKCAKTGTVPKFEAKFKLNLAMYQGKALSEKEEKRFYL